MTEEWRRQVQQKMADYEESGIDLSWPEIEEALKANRQKAMATERKAKTTPLWFRRIAAAAVVLLLAGVGYWTLERQGKETLEADGTQMVANREEPAKTIVSVNPKTILSPTLIPPQQRRGAVAPDLAGTNAEDACPNEEEPQATEEIAEQQTNQEMDKVTPASPQPRPAVIYPYELRKNTSTHSRLTAKAYFSNATTGYNSLLSSTQQIPIPKKEDDPTVDPTPSNPDNGQGYEVEVPGDMPNETDNPEGGEASNNTNEEGDSEHQSSGDNQGSNTRQGEPQQYRTQQTNETTHHHQPIRFGLSLRYRLNDRWSIESGITYTRLSADFTKTVDGMSSTTEQHLNYIGIPVSASYLLWGNRYLNVYLSAGTMVEKMVSGSRTTAGETNSVSIHPLQFSVNGAAGAEFRFSPQFSIYAEPGIGYWFDNGSSIPTYYQDKPLSFSLSFGLRVSLK